MRRGALLTRGLAATALLLLLAARPSVAPASAPLEVDAGPLRFSIAPAQRTRWIHSTPRDFRWQVRSWMSQRERRRQGSVMAVIRWPRQALASLSEAIERPATTRVRITVGMRQVEIRRPRIRQIWRNNCETAALSILLGGTPDQRRLQSLLPEAIPRVPQTGAQGVVWGDPQQGFVGDVRGGGYGVYERPILALARRVDANVVDLSRQPFVRLVDELRRGHPVLTWVTLGASSPQTWRTPGGIVVRANHAEHAVVLVGWNGQSVVYLDPWDGQRKVEDLETFAARWRQLGQRAIALQPA